MISAHLMGGLGNQLFQLATTIAVSLEFSVRYIINQKDIGTSYSFGTRSIYWDTIFKNVNPFILI